MEKQLLQILLIEDNEDDYIVVKEMLSTLQKPAFEVSWAKTYEAAIATLTASTRQPHSADCPYDACLLDYRLGQHSGLELLQQAQLQDTQIPIILLTGIDDQAVDQQAMTIGAAGFLSKDEISP
ncbi:MAG TPA: response regulator, partial [Coleofasciculaceae cyanobacterium]